MGGQALVAHPVHMLKNRLPYILFAKSLQSHSVDDLLKADITMTCGIQCALQYDGH